MAFESAEDLAGFFDPAEFGESLIATIGLDQIPFTGIYTEGPVTETPGTPGIVGFVPRIITQKAIFESEMDGSFLLEQGSLITRESGKIFSVVDLQYKNDLLIIFLHDNW